jgi:plastocyanin/peptidoglycan hydrolase-like protein with peptidoglycan-binding domain
MLACHNTGMSVSLARYSLMPFVVAALLALFPYASSAAEIRVSVVDNSFSPRDITVQQGDVVVWTNNGGMVHTVTADDGSFDSGSLLSGQSFSVTFTGVGSVQYYCRPHGGPGGAGMSGSVTVTPASAPPLQSPVLPTVSPPTTSPLLNTLRAQLQDLLARIATLKAQQASPGGSNSATQPTQTTCPLISRSLKLGSSGDDVARLQQFLARDTAIYPEGQVTGYYGTLTEAAVRRWQVKFNIVSSGDAASTGWGVTGPRTAALLALQCSGASTPAPTTPSVPTLPTPAPPVGGSMQITPVSGRSPLTVRVEATVNTTGSCAQTFYNIDYGDGTVPSQINVPLGRCTPMTQIFSHLYEYGGTYVVALSSGIHRTTITVTVSGPGKPVTDINEDYLRADITSGPAPLTVTFSGIMNGSKSCDGGTYKLIFGDGQFVEIPIPADACAAYSLNKTHTYQGGGQFTAVLRNVKDVAVSNLTIHVSGAAAPAPGPLTVIPNVDNDPKKVKVQFSWPQDQCANYSLTWGDGTNSNPPAGTVCSQSTALSTYEATHTYAANGTYTITLTRGNATDTASVVITN